jgi:hypothetical protein
MEELYSCEEKIIFTVWFSGTVPDLDWNLEVLQVLEYNFEIPKKLVFWKKLLNHICLGN